MRAALSIFFFAACPVSSASDGGPGAPAHELSTKYTGIYYPDNDTLNSFFWRISGRMYETPGDISLAKSRVDRIAERVMAILDMRPKNFKIKIILKPAYEAGRIALYSARKHEITVYADRVTDGVLAHEIAHAVISQYFASPPPERVQEILTQYVDKHLWEEYR
ncbi:MAG: hypothetical protein ABH885_05920 [Candidatus Omnitrophota bacterium]